MPPVSDVEARLAQLRALYLVAVEDERAIATGLEAVAHLRASADGVRVDPTLTAYEGALITLRAKHAFWPGTRLRHLREGLAVLDSVVARHPTHAEARYLRLMSCYYLPGVLGRSWSVRDDFSALAILLPRVRGEYPADLHSTVTQFVLRHGQLAAPQRRELEALLSDGDAPRSGSTR